MIGELEAHYRRLERVGHANVSRWLFGALAEVLLGVGIGIALSDGLTEPALTCLVAALLCGAAFLAIRDAEGESIAAIRDDYKTDVLDSLEYEEVDEPAAGSLSAQPANRLGEDPARTVSEFAEEFSAFVAAARAAIPGGSFVGLSVGTMWMSREDRAKAEHDRSEAFDRARRDAITEYHKRFRLRVLALLHDQSDAALKALARQPVGVRELEQLDRAIQRLAMKADSSYMREHLVRELQRYGELRSAVNRASDADRKADLEYAVKRAGTWASELERDLGHAAPDLAPVFATAGQSADTLRPESTSSREAEAFLDARGQALGKILDAVGT